MTEGHRLVPFEGIDDVRFGMTRDQVEDMIGGPDQVRHTAGSRKTYEQRGASEFLFTDDAETLSAITVFKPGRGKYVRERLGRASYVPLFHDGIEILAKDGFKELFTREQSKEGRGDVGVLFPELGFLVAGFRKRVPEGRYVIAFPRERLRYYEEGWLSV